EHGPITLPGLGSKFSVGSADSMGAYIYASAAGDFTGDGYPDLIGFDITGQRSGTLPSSRLILVRNQYTTNPDDPLRVDWSEIYDEFNVYTGPAAITVGDYNGDGLLDFFFMRNSADEFGYTNFLAKMYINIGTATDPQFSASSALNLDFSSSLRVRISGTYYYVYNYWAANHLESVDYDGDGDIDILMISQDKVYVLRQGGGGWRLGKFTLSELSYGGSSGRTGYTGLPGGSAIAAADFDGDGDIDIICGSVGFSAYLVLYTNDGTNNFTRQFVAIPRTDCVGVVAIMAADYTNDGRVDLFVATDAAYRGMPSYQARIWFMRNDTMAPDDIAMTFTCLNGCQP
ncbi:MAG: VCBS repeat-containing protein, partial [Candidatus Aminicenantes bacterium]|nr:VCBS repeat-containing protein [Candidatus Aminicenantes bacterium]